MKRVVVLGGAGVIGSHLCIRLSQMGHDVVCVDSRDIATSPLLLPYFRRRALRYINHNVVNRFSIDCDQIYNLASPCISKSEPPQPISTLRTNLIGSINALDVARRTRAKVVFASSCDVYGMYGQHRYGEDESSLGHISTFAESKRAAEALHYAYQQEWGISCRVARFFTTYGTGCQAEDGRVVVRMIMSALRGEDIIIHGSGEQRRTFCWVGDAVDCLIRLMSLPDRDHLSAVNIGASHEISIKALAEKIILLTGSRSRIRHVEPRLNDLRRVVPDLSLARTHLGWMPTTTLNTGLRHTIEYLKTITSKRSVKSIVIT